MPLTLLECCEIRRNYEKEIREGLAEMGLRHLFNPLQNRHGLNGCYRLVHWYNFARWVEGKLYAFYQMPYSDRSHFDFSSITALPSIPLAPIFDYRLVLPDRSSDEWDKINELLAENADYRLPFMDMRTYGATLSMNPAWGVVRGHIPYGEAEEMFVQARHILSDDYPPRNYPKPLFLFEKALYLGLICRWQSTLIEGSSWICILNVGIQKVNGGVEESPLDMDMKAIYEDVCAGVDHLSYAIAHKMKCHVYDQRFLKSPFKDIENWTINQASRLALGHGLAKQVLDSSPEKGFRLSVGPLQSRDSGGLAWVVDTGIGEVEIRGFDGVNESISRGMDEISRIVGYVMEWKRHALQSALSAIMSRNGSHNLGSHVLNRIASLSSKDATALVSDMQANAHYMQQRMDFLAQVSTTWPVWSQSTLLFNDLCREFLNQFLLLEFISRSENLRAHRYREHGERDEQGNIKKDGTVDKDEALGRIRLQVLLVPKECWGSSDRKCETSSTCEMAEDKALLTLLAKCSGGNVTRILTTANDLGEAEIGQDCTSSNLESWSSFRCTNPEKRLPVAIPGGRVGWQAFFVILENVLRNAAKHGWAGRTKDPNEKAEVLDLIIEICDDPHDEIAIAVKRDGEKEPSRLPARLVRIYDNVSKLQDKGNLQLWTIRNTGPNNKTVVGVNNKLQESLITETGELKKENWGLAEMRIAAGYLQQRSITDIGEGGDKLTGKEPKNRKAWPDLEMFRSAGGTLPGDMEPNAEKKSNEDSNEEKKLKRSDHIIRAVKSPLGTLGYEFFIKKPRVVGIYGSKREEWSGVFEDIEKNGLTEGDKRANFESDDKRWRSASVYRLEEGVEDTDFEYFVLCVPKDGVDAPKESKSPNDIFLQVLWSTLENGNTFRDEHADQRKELAGWIGCNENDEVDLLCPLSWLKIAIERYPYRLFVLLPEDITNWTCGELAPDQEEFWADKKEQFAFLYKRICWVRPTSSRTEAKDKQQMILGESGKKSTPETLVLSLLRNWIWHLKVRVRGVSDDDVEALRLKIDLDQDPGNTMSKSVNDLSEVTAARNACSSPFAKPENFDNSNVTVEVTCDLFRWKPKVNETYEKKGYAYISRHSGARNIDERVYLLREPCQVREDWKYGPAIFYFEAIGGVNSHLGMLNSLATNDTLGNKVFAMQYLEQSLIRIAVADERIQAEFSKISDLAASWVTDQQVWAAFVDEPGAYKQEMAPQHGFYEVLHTKQQMIPETKGNEFLCEKELVPADIVGKSPTALTSDMIILHQGILDKWDESTHAELPRESRKHRLTRHTLRWKDSKPFILITSGRGTPDDLPNGAKFLPISGLPSGPTGVCYEKHLLWAVANTSKVASK